MFDINVIDSELNNLLDMECFTNDTKEIVRKLMLFSYQF